MMLFFSAITQAEGDSFDDDFSSLISGSVVGTVIDLFAVTERIENVFIQARGKNNSGSFGEWSNLINNTAPSQSSLLDLEPQTNAGDGIINISYIEIEHTLIESIGRIVRKVQINCCII